MSTQTIAKSYEIIYNPQQNIADYIILLEGAATAVAQEVDDLGNTYYKYTFLDESILVKSYRDGVLSFLEEIVSPI